ncbi:MAG: winged helix-turn-helix domain-containing protein [Novosphingobium sp.]
MRLFRWLSARTIPPRHDLRLCGWELAGSQLASDEARCSPALARADHLEHESWQEFADWLLQPQRALVLLTGVDDANERARLLRLGFGDVLGSETSLREIESRALRIAAQAKALPRTRDIGPLRLDLIARDGFVAQRPVGLHPREFALIWRLADSHGVAVSKKSLVRDVWRMAHVPDTNSLAVHVFRLRAKLAVAGLAGLIKTDPAGGYFLDLTELLKMTTPFMLAGTDGQEAQAMALSTEQITQWEREP